MISLSNRRLGPAVLRAAIPMALCLVLAAASGCRGQGHRSNSATETAGAEGEPRPIAPPPAELGADERATIAVFESAARSVVFITNTAVRRDFWSMNTFEVPQGSGSGFLWDREGHVVTNFHVVYGADSIEVVTADQKSYRARMVGVDPDHDLAVLRIQAPSESLVPVVVGTSRGLRVGQKVLAIGNPFGLDHTLTTGVVSAVGRTIKSVNDRTIEGVIQTDAAINPGNSGGPLLDSFGRLIGINTQIVSTSGAFAGIGFAVPVDTVNRIVPQLVRHGKVIRPWLGVTLVPDAVTARWGIEGAVVFRVAPGSPAAGAGLRGTEERASGLRLGDVITAIGGEPVRAIDDLYRVLDRYSVGDSIAVEYYRDRERRKATLKLAAAE